MYRREQVMRVKPLTKGKSKVAYAQTTDLPATPMQKAATGFVLMLFGGFMAIAGGAAVKDQ